MSRPQKFKRPQDNLRAHAEENDNLAWTAPLARRAFIEQLAVDPYNDEPLACALAPCLMGTADEDEQAFAGDLFATALHTLTPEQLSAFFRRVEKLKIGAAQSHRNAAAYQAYSEYIDATGREPAKPELRAYIIARPESFKGMPATEDKKAWSRLWASAGLKGLSGR